MDKSILELVHESAADLKKAGVIDELTMREFDALCLSPVQEYSPEEIQEIRIRNKASQPVFAAFLNVSASTIKQWERGEKRPRGSSLKLLNLVAQKGLSVLE
jgi:putative transcriptional regulator